MRVCLVHRDIHQIPRGGICTLYRGARKAPGRARPRGHRHHPRTPPIKARIEGFKVIPDSFDYAPAGQTAVGMWSGDDTVKRNVVKAVKDSWGLALAEHEGRWGIKIGTDFWDVSSADYSDLFTGALYLDKPPEIERYNRAFGEMWEAALGEEASRDLILRSAEETRNG